MIAALKAAENGGRIRLIEKNEKLGKKLFITGKGRCNFTNACEPEELSEHVLTNKRFLFGAFHYFDNRAVCDYFEGLGLKYKIERGNRVFPASDHSSDVIKTLEKELRRLGVEIFLNTRVSGLLTRRESEDQRTFTKKTEADTKERKNKGFVQRVTGVRLADGRELTADRVILALGGKSYPSTGSDGEGEKLLAGLPVTLVPLEPSLVPLEVKEEDIRELQGLSLKNVRFRILVGEKKRYEEFGELLFTHFGLSGPIVLSASCNLMEADYTSGQKITAVIDLKPALSEQELDQMLLRDFSEQKNKLFRNSRGGRLPAKLIPVMVARSGIFPDKQVNEITKEERKRLLFLLKNFSFTVTGNRGFDEAIITRGGVNVKEINPKTMEFKKLRCLYAAGELLDVDAYTGGFNLQIAWATGALAGYSCSGAGE